jgi:hypothetical protein
VFQFGRFFRLSPLPKRMGTILAEMWISQSREILKVLERLASEKGEDRLELVNDMIFALNSIDRGVHGWRTWIQNLQLMSKFSGDELKEMKEGLIKEAREFIEYDVQVSEKHKEKIPGIVVARKPRERNRTGIA